MERIEHFIETLSDTSQPSSKREEAAKELKLIGSQQAVAALVEALTDEESSVRARAANALGRIRSPFSAMPLAEALRDQSRTVRASAAQALKHISGQQILRLDGGRRTVAALVESTKDKESVVRVRAIDALKRIGGQEALEALKGGLNDEDSFVRAKAADALGSMGSNNATEELVEALDDKESSVRASAAKALGQIGDRRAVTRLVEALEDRSVSVRANAARSLGQIGAKKATPDLIKALNDPVGDVRASAVRALGRIGDPQALLKLSEALKDEDSSVRKNAVDALGHLGHSCARQDAPASVRAITALVNVLKSDASDLHTRAAEAIRHIGDEQGVTKQAITTLVDGLEEIGREKALAESRFYIAHEFRHALTPLNAYVKMLEEGVTQDQNDREKLLSLTARIRKQTDTAFDLLNQYIDYSRLLMPQFTPTDINHLLQQSLEEFRAEFENRGIALQSHFAEHAAAEVDNEMLAQVLGNVITNAIQALNRDGSLVVATQLNREKVVITIRDTGTGVKPEHLPNVFEIGFTTKSGVRGAGIGLALSKRIVEEAHNGSITITNNAGGPGATVVITLPRKHAETMNGRNALALADR